MLDSIHTCMHDKPNQTLQKGGWNVANTRRLKIWEMRIAKPLCVLNKLKTMNMFKFCHACLENTIKYHPSQVLICIMQYVTAIASTFLISLFFAFYFLVSGFFQLDFRCCCRTLHIISCLASVFGIRIMFLHHLCKEQCRYLLSLTGWHKVYWKDGASFFAVVENCNFFWVQYYIRFFKFTLIKGSFTRFSCI